MSAGLFDSLEPRAPVQAGSESGEAYRSISQYAIAGAALAVASPLAFFDWSLVAVPIVGIVLGLAGCRQVAARSETVSGLPLAIFAVAFSTCCLAGSLTWLSIQYAAELPEGFERIDYAMLQPVEGDPATAVPETARAIEGHDVLLKGYMYPGKEQRGIVQFLLVRDQGDCCFGGNPKITDRVLVQMADRQGIEFTKGLVKVAGRFSIKPVATSAAEGGVLYHIDHAFTR